MTTLNYPGQPYPLGATWDGSGVNFALYSEHAEHVELCLFDESFGEREVQRIPMSAQTAFVWHTYLPEATPGQLYGFRVYGPYEPEAGMRFNPHKVLLDPYAKAISGRITGSEWMFAYPLGSGEDADLILDERDNSPYVPKGIVVDPSFTWGGDVPLRTPWNETIVYEAHPKGLTMLNEQIPEPLRGTYAGLGHYNTIHYLQELGVTALELLPVHQFVDDMRLVDLGLSNYWGYNSIGYFAPEARYSASGEMGQQVTEFKTMVKRLHSAGIEVILDVVYNHTAEGNHLGPTLSFKGIDNDHYYRLEPEHPRFYRDYTGTGNTLNTIMPRTMQLIMDSLRYWVLDMHVDGFRFDLAAALARGLHEVNRLGAFFEIIHQDPVLSQVKLIAEPWDIGEGGYQVGNFPELWAEWNGKYRDSVRRFWRGDAGQVGELGYRLTGSSDLYAHNGRQPYASINFVTAHDGFTMRDLVSYNEKHNEANGEGNRDGSDDNLSWNCGEEGETSDPEVLELRSRQMRNVLATLLISQGVPMILHGDEVARTQQGNNNVYCQDNELAWQPWDLSDSQREMLEWTKRMIAFRREHPVLRRSDYFQGRPLRGVGIKDISWLRPDGEEMSEEEWHDSGLRSLAVWLAGTAPDMRDQFNQPVVDDTLVVMMNSHDKPVDFTLPPTLHGSSWSLAFDTYRPDREEDSEQYPEQGVYTVGPRSLVALRHPTTVVAHSVDQEQDVGLVSA